MPGPYDLMLVSADPPLTVTGMRGQIAPSPTGGFGGWNKIARPRRVALTEWDGVDPYAQSFSIMFDRFRSDGSVEPECDAVERMARPVQEGAEPPVIQVLGAITHPDYVWVIEGLDWDPAPEWSTRGYRIRQEVTLHLLQYVADDRVAEVPAAERARRSALTRAAQAARAKGGHVAHGAKTYVVKAGDTLASIAQAKLGSYKRWPEIANLNGIRDPRNLKVGATLRLP